MIKLLTLVFFLVTLIGCEIPATKKNIRSPHLPVFADISEGQESLSNPYWVRFTSVNDDPSITLSDGYKLIPDKPSMVGTLGTHYRFKNNYYGYVMTDGAGIQYDSRHWDNGKVGFGGFIGVNQSWGLQVLAAQKVGNIGNGSVILYTSLQRRGGYQLIACEEEQGMICRPDAPASSNRVISQHQAIDLIIGTELGRFKMGSIGNNTLNFKIELGYNKILSRSLYKEDSPSNLQQNDDNFTVGVHTGFTLW